MLFTAPAFFVLLAVAVALHWALPWQRARLAVLLCASFYFYAFHHWPSLFILFAFILFNYAAALAQERWRHRLLLPVAISVNLLALGWFKYAAFVASIVQAIVRAPVPHPPVFLPLGISFFTFQVVAYQIDVHRREIAAERSLLRFAVFKCFFAQLVAGPIVRAHEFLPQLREKRRFDAEGFHHGLFLLVLGLALKIGVADVLAQFVSQSFDDPARLATSEAWTGIYWGYSTMAVGIGLLFGLALPLNFRTPYLSHSLREFWRRWHITLSSWFRDYLYIPLGGNRGSAARNLLVTMGVAGLWHGAGFTFVIWGLAHGAWLWVERALRGRIDLPRWLNTALVFHGVCVLWVLFRAPDLRVAGAYLSRLLLPPYRFAPVPGLLAAWLIGFALLQAPAAALIEDRRFVALPVRWQVAATAALLLFALAHGGAQIDFIYFTF